MVAAYFVRELYRGNIALPFYFHVKIAITENACSLHLALILYCYYLIFYLVNKIMIFWISILANICIKIRNFYLFIYFWKHFIENLIDIFSQNTKTFLNMWTKILFETRFRYTCLNWNFFILLVCIPSRKVLLHKHIKCNSNYEGIYYLYKCLNTLVKRSVLTDFSLFSCAISFFFLLLKIFVSI